LPNCISGISYGAFASKRFKALIFPNFLDDTGDYLFGEEDCFEAGCDYVVLPKSIKVIGQNTFYSTKNCGKVFYEGNLDDFNKMLFYVRMDYFPPFFADIIISNLAEKRKIIPNLGITSQYDYHFGSLRPDSEFYLYSETKPTDTKYKMWHYADDHETPVIW